jgi:hypothetical protein
VPGDAVFRRLQSLARSTASKSGIAAPTQEYLARHTLESLLDRLTRTSLAGDFVLRGGILLAVYGVRRPTKDVDANAVNIEVTAEHLAAVVQAVAAIAEVTFAGCNCAMQSPEVQTLLYPGLVMLVMVVHDACNRSKSRLAGEICCAPGPKIANG